MILRRLSTLVVAVGAALLLSPAAADAHAVLEETTPADGAVLDTAPSEVTLRFNEIVSVRDGAINVVGPDGNAVEFGEVQTVDTTVHVGLPGGLSDGSYVVSWRVISADSHPIAGAFSFAIGAPSSGVTAPSVPESSGSAGWQVVRAVVTFAAYLGVLIAAGMTTFATFVHDQGGERRQLLRLAGVAAVVGLVGVLATIPAHVVDLVGDGMAGLGEADAWGDVIRGPAGAAAVVTIVGLAVLTGAGRPRDVALDAAVGAGGVIALGGFAITGHTRSFGPWWLVVTSDLVHLVAGAVWLGGLIGVAVTLRARRADDGAGSVSSAQIVARFSALAAVCLMAVAGFGVALAWRIVGSWDALTASSYGAVLLIKIGLVAVVAVLGGYNRFRLVPRAGGVEPTAARARLARVVRAEAGVLVVVVAVTALLVDRSPTVTAHADQASAPAAERALEVDLGDTTAHVVVDPARTGSNQLVVTLSDDDGGPTDALDPPTIEFTHLTRGIGPIARTTDRTGTGTYAADIDLPAAGHWEIRVTARMTPYSKPIGVTHLDVEP